MDGGGGGGGEIGWAGVSNKKKTKNMSYRKGDVIESGPVIEFIV